MYNDRIVVARLWSKYTGSVPSRAPIIVGLKDLGYETICIYLDKESSVPNYFASEGIKNYYICEKKRIGSINFGVIMKLARLLKEQRVDILHCHRHQAVVYGALAGWIAGTRAVIAHVHGLNRTRTFGRKLINRVVLRRVKKILAVGESVKRDVLKSNSFVPDSKVVSIGNSIDTDRFTQVSMTKDAAKQRLGLDGSSFVLGAVGRLEATKGFDILIKAFKVVKERVENAELIMIGEGKLRGYLESICQELGVADSVHWLGKRNDMPEVYRAMDMFVMSSIAEGMPRVMLEAMVSGVPCVASNVGGIPEIFDDGKYGVLTEPFSPEKLAEAILAVLEIPKDELDILLTDSRKRVLDEYNHTVVMNRVDRIYMRAYSGIK